MCYKKPFSKREAATALNKNRRERGHRKSRGRKEQRMYQCEDCNYWHLTSMDEEEFELITIQKTKTP
jgi:hypothetical protein